jgi:hypothetical protein
MALEKYLLDIAKILDSKVLESWLIYLLIESKSSSISAVVTSVVLASPDKTFNVATMLFKTKKFIQADFTRSFEDGSSVKSLYSIGYGFNTWNQIYYDERLETCKDKHRTWHLESLFLNYQLFRSAEISDDKVKNRQKVLWEILDNYYDEILSEDKQTESDKGWRIFLARMDRRKMDIKTEKVENGIQLTFNPELSSELKSYSEDTQNESQNTVKYASLYLWSRNKIENNQNYKKYHEFEETPLLALQQIKEALEISHESRKFIFQDEIFPTVSIILLRDYAEVLSIEDKEFCKDLILECATLTFSPNYSFKISDGTQSAISFLPLLKTYFPELNNDIKMILLLNLFYDYQIGMSGTDFHDYAIEAIEKYYDDEEIQSFVLAYLYVKPKYDTQRAKIIKEAYGQGNQRIDEKNGVDNFIQNNEKDIQKFIANELSADNLDDVKNTELHVLNVAFKMIPITTQNSLLKQIAKDIIEIFTSILVQERRSEKVEFEVKQGFINRLSIFILEAEHNDIEIYLRPLIDNFHPSEELAKLLTQFILTQDKSEKYDNFWYVWRLFEDKIIELCNEGDTHGYIDQIIKAYLLVWSPYGEIWKDTAKEWHSLKDKDRRFFKRISEEIGHCPTVLYSISKLLTEIGSPYLSDGIGWISNMLRKNSNLLTDKLEVNTIFHLENLIRKYIFINTEKIKKEKKTKEDTLIILNFLIEKESSLGYMLRERIL